MLEVICGPMYAGKTEELIRRLRRAVIARQRVQVFKPTIDRRYHATRITSHSEQSLDAQSVPDAATLRWALLDGTQVVGIDEAQFFGTPLVEVVEEAMARGQRVIVAGLDLDSNERPFEPLPHLLALADAVTKLAAVCVRCGQAATRSHRISHGTERIEVGGAEAYEALCAPCMRRARIA